MQPDSGYRPVLAKRMAMPSCVVRRISILLSLHALQCMVAFCSVEWDEPYGGECTDVFVLGDGGFSLTQLSDMTIRGSGRRCKYRRVFGAGKG